MADRNEERRFEAVIMPHLESGFNLALWIVTDRHDAEDALQNASVKAFQALDRFRGTDSKAWFLMIVRNECMNRLQERNRTRRQELSFDENLSNVDRSSPSPAEVIEHRDYRNQLVLAIDSLTPDLREVLLLREIEQLSYLEIASVIQAPVGTVMSRLSRARSTLSKTVTKEEESF